MLKLILNTLCLILMIGINYLSATGQLFSKTVGEVSHKYDTLLTPADYTFSIWGLIYILLIVFIIYNWFEYIKNNNLSFVNQIGYWFIISCIANASWILVWLNEWIGFSVINILVLLFSLIQIIRNLNMEKWDAPVNIIFFIWWPICIYFGWIVFATIANINLWLIKMEWLKGILSEQLWTILLIIIIMVIYSLLIYYRNMREAAMVGVWGLIGIVVSQWHGNKNIVIVSIITSFVLFAYASYHGYINRKTSPLEKLKK